jgi:importin subunit beta-1
MRKEETEVAVRLAATVALFNALEFAQTNFENPDERNYIMQMICNGTIATEANLREASFECLVKMASHYYAKLPAYMNVRISLPRPWDPCAQSPAILVLLVIVISPLHS